jgi:hypothetical protein
MALIQKAFSDIITFSRSSNATRIGPTGRVEYAPHNLLLRSQEFDNAAWTKDNCTATANAIAAPDGTITADLITDGASGSPSLYLTSSISITAGVPHTASGYLKRGNTDWVRFILPDGSFGNSTAVWFNLATGAASTGGTLTSVGNGWYRFSVSATIGSATTAQYQVNTATANFSNTRVSGGTYYIWGAQLSVGPYPLDYTPTTTAAVYGPRFDYDPVTLAARGLLIEEQRTNLVTYSEQIDNAYWTVDNATVTANATTAPDGTSTADLLTENSSSGAHRFYRNITLAAASHSASIYAKPNGRSWIYVRMDTASGVQAWFNISTGQVGTVQSGLTASIQSVGNGWYRCAVSGTAVAANNFLVGLANADNTTSYTGDGTSGAYLWGAQLEAGAFATSYIPTVAASVTRSADVASVDTLSPWWNNVEGTLFADYTAKEFSYVVAPYTDANNYMILNAGTTGSVFDVVNAGSVQAAIGTRSLSAKIAARFKNNDFAVCLNGGAVATDTAGTVPSITDRLALGYLPGFSVRVNGHLRRVAFYPRALTSAELQAITA